MKPAILFLAHELSEAIVDEFETLKSQCSDGYAVILVFHSPSGARPQHRGSLSADIWIADDAGIRSLGFTEFERPPDLQAGASLIFPGNVDFLQLSYQGSHPDHPYYWVVESDVRFSGQWAEFFSSADETTDADLLATSFATRDEYPGWSWWPTLNVPAGESLSSPALRCFCPIYRISRTGGEALADAYRRGWSGHAEVVMPTLFRGRGLKLEDLGGRGPFVSPGNEDRFYKNDRLDRDLFPGTLRYRPPRLRVGRRQGMLWHPVKPSDRRTRSIALKLYDLSKTSVRYVVDRLARSVRTRPSTSLAEATRHQSDKIPTSSTGNR